jgi:hypothetical protein
MASGDRWATTQRPGKGADDQKNQENKHQELRDECGGAGQAIKALVSRHQRENEKSESPTEYRVPSAILADSDRHA